MSLSQEDGLGWPVYVPPESSHYTNELAALPLMRDFNVIGRHGYIEYLPRSVYRKVIGK